MFDGLISSFVKMREGNDDLKRVFLLIFRDTKVIIFDRRFEGREAITILIYSLKNNWRGRKVMISPEEIFV